MKPDPRFLKQPPSFWASVRSLSQKIGYARKRVGFIVPSHEQMANAFQQLNLDPSRIVKNNNNSPLSQVLQDYFKYRGDVLTAVVEPRLMDAKKAQSTYRELREKLQPTCPLPMNKQKGDKKAEAFLTCIVNMMVEANGGREFGCDYDPRQLTTFTRDGAPLRTLARRVDGAFPSVVNPVAIWEIKEYYYTTTFGSRVADGVYETLLDGLELEELREHEGIDVKHYLFVDAYRTWWEDGKSYLCRMVDMLHQGYVDEVLFGYEAVEELPRIVGELVGILKNR